MLRKLIWLALLLASSPALAALTLTNGAFVQGTPPGTCTISSTVGAGQVIGVLLGAGGTSVSLADTSTNSYSLLYRPSGYPTAIYWAVTSASESTTTITLSGSSGATYFQCFSITGFTGTPTSDVSIQNDATATSTNPAISATSNFANEILLVNLYTATLQTVTASGWTAIHPSSANNLGFYAYEATSGTANNFSATITSAAWHLALAGIYDTGSEPTCTHSGLSTTGTIAVPNGSSGSYRLANGSIGTPDCSTKLYPNSAGGIAVN